MSLKRHTLTHLCTLVDKAYENSKDIFVYTLTYTYMYVYTAMPLRNGTLTKSGTANKNK